MTFAIISRGHAVRRNRLASSRVFSGISSTGPDWSQLEAGVEPSSNKSDCELRPGEISWGQTSLVLIYRRTDPEEWDRVLKNREPTSGCPASPWASRLSRVTKFANRRPHCVPRGSWKAAELDWIPVKSRRSSERHQCYSIGAFGAALRVPVINNYSAKNSFLFPASMIPCPQSLSAPWLL